MNKEEKKLIQRMLYEQNNEQVLNELYNINEPTILYIFAYNYNWDNGFEIPKSILQKKSCDLNTALMMFYSADGIRYLENKNEQNDNLKSWLAFIKKIYNRIINAEFLRSDIKFTPPLSKVQMFKLKKEIEEKDYIFLEEIGDRDLNIIL